jgi:hypothetical protein
MLAGKALAQPRQLERLVIERKSLHVESTASFRTFEKSNGPLVPTGCRRVWRLQAGNGAGVRDGKD